MNNFEMRPMLESDLELVLRWRNAPEIRNNMYTQHEISWDEHVNWFKCIDPEDTKYFIFEIDNDPVGVINFSRLKRNKRQAEWGFYSGDLSRRGIGKAMEVNALEYAFTKLGLEKLNCEVLSNNMPVVSFHRKFGFSVEGILKGHFEHSNGDILDIYKLAITKKEWELSQENLTAYKVGDKYQESFLIDDKIIELFGQASGDMNPVHFSTDEAQKAGFKDKISHGILHLGFFSKILGTTFPGKGTIYTKQTACFLRPIYAGSEINVEFRILSIIKRRMTISTIVKDAENNICIKGEAEVVAPKA